MANFTKAQLQEQLRQQNATIRRLTIDLKNEQEKRAQKVITEPARATIKRHPSDAAEIARLKALVAKMEREANEK